MKSLVIDITAVPYLDDLNNQAIIQNICNDSVISDPKTPKRTEMPFQRFGKRLWSFGNDHSFFKSEFFPHQGDPTTFGKVFHLILINGCLIRKIKSFQCLDVGELGLFYVQITSFLLLA